MDFFDVMVVGAVKFAGWFVIVLALVAICSRIGRTNELLAQLLEAQRGSSRQTSPSDTESTPAFRSF